jgi:hypothetical protein
MPAPRKALLSKKMKRATPEAAEQMLPKLKLIKAKHAARVLQLSRTALRAMKELETIEAAMDLEAAAEVHDDYIDQLPDFKLTFEAAYAQHAEEADDTSARLDDCMGILIAIEKDAADTFPSEMAAAAAVEAAPASLREGASEVEAATAAEAAAEEK